jgi:predicted permease
VTRERARRVYRGLLRLAPRRVRRHAPEMEALFLEMLDDARASGRRAVGAAWLAAAADLFRSAVVHRDRRRRSVPHLPRERRAIMLGTDLKYTFRWLMRQKFSTSLVVAMLSLGIAANVVVFSLVSALFLRPFPFDQPERLVFINETAPRWNLDVVGVNYPDFDQWRKNAKLFDGLALHDRVGFNLSDDHGAERIDGGAVTYDWPAVLRIQPLLGRMFTAEEDRPKAPPVVVIGESLWRERFGASPDVLGRTLKLNGVTRTIVGVMPKVAEFPGGVRLWVPIAGDPAQNWQSYGYEGVVGRLKRGVSIADAEKDLRRAHQPIWDARDNEHAVSPFAHDLKAEFVHDYRTSARTLVAAVGILLIVACANVASIMLARALARRREMGIRLAVGASRTRLARQLFVENLVLAAIGGVIGLAAGRWALRLLLASAGDQVPQWADFSLDFRVIAFSILLTAATTLCFGWAPALHAIRGNLRGAMHDASAATTRSPGGRRTLSLLVGAEFALAAVLLVCGGLLFRAYDKVRHVDPGFRADHVLTFTIALPEVAYGSDAKQLAFWDRLSERLATVPGVEAAGMVSCPPLGCHWGTFYDIEGRAPLAKGAANPVVLYRPATPGYFKAMGIRLKRGRFFDDHDRGKTDPVIIVNETFVKTFWPGVSDPVGRRIRGTSKNAPWMRVVGMVGDIRHYGLERPMRPGIYVPLAQAPNNSMTVAIRTAGGPAALAPTARGVVRELDPDLPLYRVRTMEEAVRRSMSERALFSWLLAVFASMALLLALGGTYGVTSYLVSQRTREIGIRVALGARTLDITRTVLLTSLRIVGSGILLGIAGAIAAGRLLADQLFGVSAYDPRILLGATAVLLLTSAASNWLPAHRASRVDPMQALKVD